MRQVAKRASLLIPPVRRLYEQLLAANLELDRISKEAAADRANASAEADAARRRYQLVLNTNVELERARAEAEAAKADAFQDADATRKLYAQVQQTNAELERARAEAEAGKADAIQDTDATRKLYAQVQQTNAELERARAEAEAAKADAFQDADATRKLYAQVQQTNAELERARAEAEAAKADAFQDADATRKLYAQVQQTNAELERARAEAEAEKAKAVAASAQQLGNVSEFVDRWCGKHLVAQARANLFVTKALQSASDQPGLGTRWDDYSKKLIGDIAKFDSIVEAVAYAQTEIGFETRPHESACGDFVDMMVASMNATYPHCAEMISRAGESPLSLVTHSAGVVKRGNRLFALQQIINVEAFCYIVTKLGAAPRSVLEIGGGYGSSCRDWINMSGDRLERYYILDIPESLFYSEIYLKAHFGPSAVVHLAELNSAKTVNEFKIVLCPLPLIDRLLDVPIDVAINVGSMQEMSGDWLEYYQKFLSKAQVSNFYSSNYFLQPLGYLNESMNIFTPRLSAAWELVAHQFMIDEAEQRHVMRALFAKRASEEVEDLPPEDLPLQDVDVIESRSLGGPIDVSAGEAPFRFLLAAKRGTEPSVLLRGLRGLVSKFPYVPKEALYLARLISEQADRLDQAEREEIEQLRGELEGLVPEWHKAIT